MIGGSAGFRMMIALPSPGAAQRLQRAGGGDRELVDVLSACPGRPTATPPWRRSRRTRTGPSGRQRRDERHRRLRAARDQVHLRRVEVLVQVDVRAPRPGPSAAGVRSMQRMPRAASSGACCDVRVRRRRVERQVDLRVLGQERLEPAGRSSATPSVARPREALGRRVDPDHRDQLERRVPASPCTSGRCRCCPDPGSRRGVSSRVTDCSEDRRSGSRASRCPSRSAAAR